MFRIGYRTIKTAAGTTLAIMLSQWFHLHNFASAGIITILCIKNTKVKSFQAAWTRFLACILAMIFSACFFEGIAYHPAVIGIMLLFFIPTAVMVNAAEGIVTSSVIILHIYSAGRVTSSLLLNELCLIVIGIGIALLMNLYMPSVDETLYRYQEAIEKNFRRIFEEVISYLRTHKNDWDGKEITEAARLLEEAKELAAKDAENHPTREENLFYHYFVIREKQFEIIERLLPILTVVSCQVKQSHMIADFLEELKDNIHPGNTAHFYLKKLYDMKVEFEKMELPKTREEFETRAALFQFVREMEQYLIIKSSFKGLKRKANKKREKAER
jgi:uncharacterized membrane protein YgaE (UPF0421/DUF939 family)